MTEVQLSIRYAIALPTDYDMGIIRERVRTRGSALDDRRGLSMKAYCIRERGQDDSRVNEYAPFYLWGDATAAADFLWEGSGFEGIVRDFGRPRVDTWVPAAVFDGQATSADVTHAAIRLTPLPATSDLVSVATTLREQTRAAAERHRVHRAFAGIDPANWTGVEFRTFAGQPDDSWGTTLQVLHVSEPRASS